AAEEELGPVVVTAEFAESGEAVLGDHVGGDELTAAVTRVELLDRAERAGLAMPDEPVLPARVGEVDLPGGLEVAAAVVAAVTEPLPDRLDERVEQRHLPVRV